MNLLRPLKTLIIILLITSCASERGLFMIVSEQNYNDSKGAAIGVKIGSGSTRIRKTDQFDLEYEYYNYQFYKVHAGMGFNFNRFSMGISGSIKKYKYNRDNEIESFEEDEPFTFEQNFKRVDQKAEFVMNYTFTIITKAL